MTNREIDWPLVFYVGWFAIGAVLIAILAVLTVLEWLLR